MNPYPLLLVVVLFAVSAGVISEAHAQIVEGSVNSLARNSFRQNLIQLDSTYFVSVGYTSSNTDNNGNAEHQLVFRLYTFTDGIMALTTSQNIGSVRSTPSILTDTLNPSLHTAVVRLSDDTIAVASDPGGGGSPDIRTYAFNPASEVAPFTQTGIDSVGSPGQVQFPSLLKLSDTRLAMVYTTGTGPFPGQFRLFSISESAGDLLLGSVSGPTKYDNQYRYNSMVKADDDTLAISHRGNSAYPSITGVDIPATDVITPGTRTNLSVDHRASYTSLVRIDDSTLAMAYSDFGQSPNDDIGGAAYLQLISRSGTTFQTVGSPVAVYAGGELRTVPEQAHFSSLVLVDSDTLVVAYRGEGGDGYIRSYTVAGSGTSSTLTSDGLALEHDTEHGAFNSLIRINDNTVALAYSGDQPSGALVDTHAVPSTVKTFTVGAQPAPTVTSVSATDGSYGTGSTVPITVTYSDSVTVSGIPTLTLNTGSPAAVANYASGSGTTQLVFNYVVGTGDDTASLDYAATTSLVGTITSTADNTVAAHTVLPATGSAESLGNSNVIIDTVAPTFVSAVATSTFGLSVTTTEPLAGTPNPAHFTVSGRNLGPGAVVITGSNIGFSITVSHADDLTVSYTGDSVTDLAGNPLVQFTDESVTNNIPAPPSVTEVTAPAGDYKLGEGIPIFVTFSEPITVTGAPQIILDIGGTDVTVNFNRVEGTTQIVFRYVVAAGHNTDNFNYAGTDSLELNGGSIVDADDGATAELALPATTAPESLVNIDITVDTTAPAPAISSNDATSGGTTGSQSISYAVTFGEAVTGFDSTDITVTGSAPGASVSSFTASGDDYTFDVNVTDDGTVTVDIPATVATDAAGNANSASNTYTVTVNTAIPTATISATTPVHPDFTNETTIPYTVTFSEAVTGFDSTDISVSGTASGTVSGFTGSGSSYTFNVGTTSDGTVIVTIAAGVAVNGGSIGNAEADVHTLTRDTVAPAHVSAQTTSDTVIEITTSEDLFGATASDQFTVTDKTTTGASFSGSIITVTVSEPILSTDDLDVTYTGSTITDLAGTILPGFTLDVTNNVPAVPTVTLVSATGGPYGLNGVIPIVVRFSEPVTVSGTPQIRLNIGGTLTPVDYTSGSPGTDLEFQYTVPAGVNEADLNYFSTTSLVLNSGTIAASTGGATAILTLPELASDDSLGGSDIVIDTIAPTFSSAETTDSRTAVVTLSEQLIGTTGSSDFLLEHDDGGFTAFTLDGASRDDDTVILIIDAEFQHDQVIRVSHTGSTLTDAAGNALVQFTNQPVTNNVPDTTAPTVVITGDTVTDGSATNTSPISYTATFSEDVMGFDLTDITLGGDSTASVTTLTGTGAVYNFDVTATVDGTLTVSIAEDAATDDASNGNDASNVYTVTVDTVLPTVTITGDTVTDGSATNTSPISYTVEFNEIVTGFVEGDITVTGSANGGTLPVSNFAGTGTTYTFDVAVTSDGTVVTSIAAGVATDDASNGNAISTTHTVTFDTVEPTVVITSGTVSDDGITNTPTIQYTATFDKPVTGFVAGDITVSGTANSGSFTVSNFVPVPGGTTYTFNVATTSDGTVSVSILAGVATDAAGNTNAVSDAYDATIDTAGLTVTLSSGTALNDAATNAGTISYTATFSKTVTDFVVGDISVTGSANGGSFTVSSFVPVTGGTEYTFDVDVTSDGTVIVSIPAGVATDTAGSGNTVSNEYTVTVDTVVPTVEITSNTDTGSATTSQTVSYTVTFNEAVSDFVIGDITVAGTANTGTTLEASNFVAASGTVYTFNVVTTTDGTIEVSIPVGVATDAASNPNTVSSPNPYTVTVDSTGPTVEITSTTVADSTITSRTVSYTATFNEAVSDFVEGDITVAGTANTGTTLEASSFAAVPGGTVYTFDVETTTDGTIAVSIPANVATDAVGNGNSVSNTYSVTVDTGGPTVAISTDTDNGGTTNDRTISYTVTFNEAVSDFVIGDITVTGTANTGTTLEASNFVAVTGGTVYTFDVETTTDGTVAVSIAAGVATDSVGNQNTISETYTVTIDTSALTVILSSDTALNDAAINAGTISYTATFSAAVSDFDVGDITVTGTANTGTTLEASNFVAASGTVYTFDVAVTSDGTVVTSIADGVANAASNANTASIVYTVTVDTAEPTVEITSSTTTATGSTTNSGTISYTATFDEVVSGFELSDISVTGTANTGTTLEASNFVAASGTVYTFDVAVTSDGTVTTIIPAGIATDAASNGNTASNTYLVTVDATAPTVSSAGTRSANTIAVTASETLSGSVAITEFTVLTNGDDNNVSGAIPSGSTITLTVDTDIVFGDIVTVSYTGTGLADAATNDLATFANLKVTVTNNVAQNLGTISYSDTIDGLSGPQGVATNSTHIFVADTVNHQVKIFRLDGTLVSTIGTGAQQSGNDAFSGPGAVATNSTHIFVMDSGNQRVQILEHDGTYASTIGGGVGSDNNQFRVPSGIAANSTHIFVADSSNNRIQIFDLSGNHADTIGAGEGDGDNHVDFPAAVAINSENIFVAESDNHRVHVFTLDGTHVSTIGTGAQGSGNDQFNVPSGIALNSTHIFVADTNNHRVQIFTLDGALTGTVGSAGSGNDQFSSPFNMATNSTHLFVADRNNDRVQIFELDVDTLTVEITSSVNNGATTTIPSTAYTATFNRPVTDFALDDISVTGTADSGNPAASGLAGGDAVYTFNVATTTDGTITVSIPAGSATDADGIPNLASNTYEVTVDSTAPTVSAETTSTTTILITASEPLVGTADENDFTVSSNTVSAAVVSDSTITLTVDTPIRSTDTVTVSYIGTGLADAATNVLAFTNQPVTNNVPAVPTVSSVTSSGGPYKAGDEVTIIVTFSESVDVTGTPQLTLETGTTDAVVDYATGSPGTELTFTYTVAAGHNSDDLNYVGTGSLALNGGTIAATAGGATAILTLPATDVARSLGGSDVIIDTIAPTFSSAEATFDVVITVSEQLIGTTGRSDFILETQSSSTFRPITLDGASASGDTVTLRPDEEFLHGQAIRVSHTGDTLTDAAGNALVQFTNQPVTNNVPDTTAPTVTVTSAITAGSTTSSRVITYTATFSEDVTGFDAISDITVDGTATATAAAPTGGPTEYTFVVTATTDGTVEVSIPANAATDAAPNGNDASNTHTITIDTTGLTVSLSSGTAINNAATTIQTISYRAEFSGAVDDFVIGDITVTGTANGGSPAASNFMTVSDTVYTFDVVVTSDGTVVTSIAAGVANDAVPNANAASDVYTVTVDTAAPTVEITSTVTAGSATSSRVITYTATFSEDVTGFDLSDITVGGTATASSAAPTGGAAVYTFVVTATTDGTVEVSIPADAATDAASHASTASDTYTVTIDTVAPTVTITSTTAAGSTTNSQTVSYTATFNEAVTGFVTSDIGITGTGTATAGTVTGGPAVYTFDVTSTVDGTIIATIPAGAATDPAGNANTASTPYTVTIDSTAPTFSSAGTTSTTTIDVIASDPLAGTPAIGDFTIPDYTVSAATISGSTITITVNTAITSGDTITVALTGTSVTDLAGNALVFTAQPVTNNVPDTTAPTVEITSSTANHEATTGTQTVSYTATFSETVTGFAIGDITVTGSANTGTTLEASNFVAVTGGTTYTFDVVTTTDGTVTVSIPASSAADAAGNQNDVSNTYTVTIDTTGLSVSLTSGTANDGATTNAGTISYTATFSAAVSDFVVGDITVTGSANGGSPVPSNFAGSGTTYTFDVVVTSDGTVVTSIAAGVANDAIPNANIASNTYTVTVDATAPTFSSAGTTSSTTIDVIASESLDGIPDIAGFTISGNTISSVAVSGSTITITVNTAITSTDALTVALTGTSVTDLAGNALAFTAEMVTNNVPDTTAPTVVITSTTDAGSTTTSQTVSYTATFSEDVTGFDAISDITVGGTATATAAAPTGSGAVYNFVVTSTVDGTLTVTIPAGAVTDAATNANTISDTYTVTIDSTAPTFVSAATASSTTIEITTSESLIGTATASNFAVSGNTVSTAAISTSTITLTVGTAIASTDTLTVSYTGSTITDAAGNALASFSGQTVTNNVIPSPTVTSVTAPAGDYRLNEGIPVTVTFSESVDTTGTPQLTLDIGGTLVPVDIDRGTGTTELVFRYVVAAGHNTDNFNYAGTDSLALNGGTIVATATGNAAADLTLPDLTSASSLLNSNVIIDTVSPTIVRSIATGTGIVEVTTSEALAESTVTDTTVTMTIGGTPATITDVSLVAGNNIVITTSNTLSSTDVIIVTLTAVTDLAGNTLTDTDTLSDDEKSLLGTDNMVSITNDDNVFVIQETIPVDSVLVDETDSSVDATFDLSGILAASDNPNADAIIPAAFSITRPGITIELQATTGVSGLPDSNQILLSELARTAVLPQSANVDFAVEIGSPDLDITLSNPARITFSGLSGSTPYYVNAAGATTLITAPCENDSVGSLGITTGECQIVSGNDLVIWTYHFTTFGAFTVQPTPPTPPTTPTTPEPTSAPRRSGGGGGGGLPPDERVCGASLCSDLVKPTPSRIDGGSNFTRSTPEPALDTEPRESDSDTDQDRDSPPATRQVPEPEPEPAREPEPRMDPEPSEPGMDPEPSEPGMDPEPSEPEMDPEPSEPGMDPEPAQSGMDPEPATGERNIFESIIAWFGSLFG